MGGQTAVECNDRDPNGYLIETADYAPENELGLSKFISFAATAFVADTELIEYLQGDDATDVILLYLEEVRDGPGLVESTMARLKKALPATANRKDPVDVIGDAQKPQNLPPRVLTSAQSKLLYISSDSC